jgi:hypothetical protein
MKIFKTFQTLLFIMLGFLLPAIQVLAEEKNPLNPLGDTSGGPPALYGRLIKAFLGAISVAALFFFIVGGFILLTSRGNPEKVKTGKDTLVWAIIGLFVAFTSFILVRYVLEIIITPV